jgi:hypothetical protein
MLRTIFGKMLNKCNPYHDKGIMIDNISFSRKEVSTFLALSAAILMLLSSPLLLSLSNPLLQPVQAQTTLSFRTPIPANGTATEPNVPNVNASITFDAQGGTFVDPRKLEANGTFQITDSSSRQILYSGYFTRVQADSGFANVSNSGKQIIVFGDLTKPEPQEGIQILISTSCSTSASNDIGVENLLIFEDIGDFSGPVECSSSQGGGDTTTQQSSSSMAAGSSQHSNRDGIPDSSDKCANSSNPRCFKEDNSTTTDQPQSSSSTRAGNQTR